MTTTVNQPPTGELLERLRAQVAVQEARFRLSHYPVHPDLAGLLPDGGLKPGAAYSMAGCGALLLALLAEPSREGYWCGVIGMPEFGVEAAAHAGVALDRLALVPDPDEQWLAATAALVEALPVVAVRPSGRVSEGDAARLMSRLRDREAVLLVDGPWPRSEARLTASQPRWLGVGAGYGHLEGREVTVTATSRRLPVPRAIRLVLPGSDGRLGKPALPAQVDRPIGLKVAG